MSTAGRRSGGARGRGLRVEPLGDAAAYIELGKRVDTALNTQALRLAAALGARRGVREAVGAYAAVTVHFDPEVISLAGLERLARQLHREKRGEPLRGRLHRVPVSYDGPDLQAVADRVGVSAERVVEIHSAPVYRAFMAAFVPGWIYLGPLPKKLELPRLAEPRLSVPAGSVAIAGQQTGIYPLPTPGGWHLLGRTALKTFLPDSDPPLLIRPGDRVKFFPR